MKQILTCLLAILSLTAWGQTPREKWGETECQRWLDRYGEIRGINCPNPPNSEVSYEQCVQLAASLGYNSLRWWPGGSNTVDYINNVESMARLCAKYGMTVSPVLHTMASDLFAQDDSDASLDRALDHVRRVMSTFRGDNRIILWDLWNEPERNYSTRGIRQMEWITRLAQEARSVGCTQPLSASILWEIDATDNPNSTWNKYRYAAEMEMDIHNYHDYDVMSHDEAETDLLVQRMRSLGERPMVCTECLTRTNGSTLARSLIHMSQYNIGFYTWGLYCNDANWETTWGVTTLNAWEPSFHNLLYADGDAMNPGELHWIRDYKWNQGKPNNDPGTALTEVWPQRRAWKLMAGHPLDAPIYSSSIAAAQAVEKDSYTGHAVAVTLSLSAWNSNANSYYSGMQRLLRSAEKKHISVVPILLSGSDLKYSAKTLKKYVREIITKYKAHTSIRAWVVVNQDEADPADTPLLMDILQGARWALGTQPLVVAPRLDGTLVPDTLGEDAASMMMRMSDVVGYSCSLPLDSQWVDAMARMWQRPVVQITAERITLQNPPQMRPHHERWTGEEVWQWMQRAPVVGLQCQSVEEALDQLQGHIEEGTGIHVNLDIKALRNDTTAYYALMDSLLSLAQRQGLSVLPTLQTDKGQNINIMFLVNSVRRLITRYAWHPAILAWNLWDQPNKTTYSSSMLANLQRLMDTAREVGPCQPVIVTPAVSANIPSDMDCVEALAHSSSLGSNGWNRLTYGRSNISECYKYWCESDFVGFTSQQPQRETAWVASVAYKFGRPVMCSWGTASGEPNMLLERKLPDTVHLWYGSLPITDQLQSVTPDVPSQEMPLYNIQGMRVGQDYRGLVIQGGKKFLKVN